MRPKYIYSIFIFLFCGHVASAQYTRYTYHDEEQTLLKEIYHVSDSISNILEGKYLSYYINGNIESEGQFSNNETVGQWDFYYETGKLKMRGLLKNSSSDGYWEYFYENGNKSMEGEIIDMKRTGEWKIYYESGALKEVGNFSNNMREGPWIYYFEDGRKKGEIFYTQGRGNFTEYYSSGEKRAEGPKTGRMKVGDWNYYYKQGNVQAEGEYQNGKKTGLWKYYHHNGTVSAIGSYRLDKPEGEWAYYYDNGFISSKGGFMHGEKSGYWGLFYEDGSLKGETTFENGRGIYKEFYKSGKIKVKGPVVQGKGNGLWKYYYEEGALQGECRFVDGRGEYHGFYPDGTLQCKGIIEEGKKIGKWKLFENDGTLSGFYRPVYNENIVNKAEIEKIAARKKHGVADFKFRAKSSFKYFDAKVNEFQGVIISLNPFTSFIGHVPLGIEFYMQERLGYEFQFQSIRDPFYTRDTDVALDQIYRRGYGIAIKQKFYNNGGRYGLWYFGHQIGFTNVSHFANLNHYILPGNVVRASASEQKFEYSLFLGYRLMENTTGAGFTADGFVGLGTGYRSFDVESAFEEVFSQVPQDKVPLTFHFGLNLGYTLAFGARGRR